MDWRDTARTYGRGLGATVLLAGRAFVAWIAALFLLGLVSAVWGFVTGSPLRPPQWATAALAVAVWLPLAAPFWPTAGNRQANR